MLWDKSSWPERVVVIWGLLIASSAVLYVAVSLSKIIFENSSTIASWVQAVGSIAAIYFVANGTKRQIESAQQLRITHILENNRNMARTCFEIAGGVVSVSKSCGRYVEGRDLIPLERINDLQETLRVLLPKDMPSELVKNIFALQKILGNHKEILMKINAMPKPNEWTVFAGKPLYIGAHRNLVNSVLRVRSELKAYMLQLDDVLADEIPLDSSIPGLKENELKYSKFFNIWRSALKRNI